jgi:tRNA A-37 threonylcarbamoyl transferase component Bud32
MALKVVQKCKTNVFSMEKLMHVEAAKCCDFVMPIEKQQEDLDWALLLSHVWSPVGPNQYKDVIRLLASLHEKGFLHGDPHLAHVVSAENKFQSKTNCTGLIS